MASKNALFYSMKFNSPETVKSHRTMGAAIKAAGDYGMIFDREGNQERQVHLMSNKQLRSFPEGSGSHESMDFKFSDELLKLGLIENQ